MIRLDFETKAITGPTSHVPPEPVGFALQPLSGKSNYYAWGHPAGNNCTRDYAARLLRLVWDSKEEVCFHNAPFDLAVAEKWFNLPWLPWQRVHDSLLLSYLYDPLASTLSLKPTAERLLDLPPAEQDAVHQWLVDNKAVAKNDKQWGAKIAKAPGDVVGPYAEGDIRRTALLVKHLLPLIKKDGMAAAYDRERQLQPILHRMTQRGIQVKFDELLLQEKQSAAVLAGVDNDIRNLLGVPNLNIDANADLAEALKNANKMAGWGKTPKGKNSIARDSLIQYMNDPVLAHLLAYRGALATIHGTFLKGWVSYAAPDGRLHPAWDQVRGPEHGGTRTGRIASNSPNFTNVPKESPIKPPEGYPPLPVLRNFIVPENDSVYVAADYSGQELRVLAHFAEGKLADLYRKDPDVDVHQAVRDMIEKQFKVKVERKAVKAVLFSLIYGAGVASISKKLGLPIGKGQELVNAVLTALPGVASFKKEVQEMGDSGKAVRTWGGRLLKAPELPPMKNSFGQEVTPRKGYALVNYLIQGSSADQTKQALIDYDNDPKRSGELLVQVYDEIGISAPAGDTTEIDRLKQSMEAGQFDVPVRVKIQTAETWGACNG